MSEQKTWFRKTEFSFEIHELCRECESENHSNTDAPKRYYIDNERLTKGRESKMAKDFEQNRIDRMFETLNELNDNELMSLYRDANYWDGSYEFVDGWDMDEFLSMMIEGKRGSELRDFIFGVAEAVNDYSGSDGIEYAMWGYFDGYSLEIKDESDIIEEGRNDYIDELTQDIIDSGRTQKFSELPSEVEELLDQFDAEDRLGWVGAGTYLLDNDEDDPANYKTFDDEEFDAFVQWIEDNDDDGASLVEN